MKNLTKETFQVIKINFINVLLFEVLYRLITGPFYLSLVDRGLKFALKMGGYSYLTAGNIGLFLIKPWTLVCMMGIGLVGLILLTFEIGGLITAFQGAAYYQKLNVFELIFGGMRKLWDECCRRNWKLMVIALIDYSLMQIYLIYRMLAHVKPLNFIMSGMMEEPGAGFLMLALLIGFILISIPTMFVFHGCMVEQKSFRDSVRRSMGLLKGHGLSSALLLIGYNSLIVMILILVYVLCVFITAVCVVLFTDKNLALAVLLSSCDKIEVVLLFFASIIIVVVNYAAITVQYYQYSNRQQHESRWDFDYPKQGGWSHKMVTGVVCAVSALSVCYIYDIVQNGSAISDDVLVEIQITAHRGSSKTAPENTMPSLAAAVAELADFAEIDVQETQDGHVVLFHDTTLKRVAGLNRTVKSMTLEELQQLDAGTWFSKEYEGEKIPTLEQAMDFCKGKLNLNIEIKNAGKETELPRKVLDLIKQFEMEEQCVVTSTNLSYLRNIKELNPDIKTGYIISAAYGNYYSNDAVDFISLRSSFVNEKLVAAAHEQGKTIHAWTVNSKSEMERMKLLGVDNIITDYPVLTREIVYREQATENLLEYLRLVLK